METIQLLPAPNWPLLARLADRYERTGEGEAELPAAFEHTVELGEVLASYAVALVGGPRRS